MEEIGNDNFTRYVGYRNASSQEELFFNKNTINLISKKVTQLLEGVDPLNRKIVVPDKTIENIMDSVYSNFRPAIGDIYTRYIVRNVPYNDNYFQQWIDQTIEIIVSDIKNQIGIEQNNSKLTIWTTVLGENNPEGLRAHAPITIRNRHPEQMQFNMNY